MTGKGPRLKHAVENQAASTFNTRRNTMNQGAAKNNNNNYARPSSVQG